MNGTCKCVLWYVFLSKHIFQFTLQFVLPLVSWCASGLYEPTHESIQVGHESGILILVLKWGQGGLTIWHNWIPLDFGNQLARLSPGSDPTKVDPDVVTFAKSRVSMTPISVARFFFFWILHNVWQYRIRRLTMANIKTNGQLRTQCYRQIRFRKIWADEKNVGCHLLQQPPDMRWQTITTDVLFCEHWGIRGNHRLYIIMWLS